MFGSIGKKTAVVMGYLLVIVFLFLVYAERGLLMENPFLTQRAFADPSHAVTAGDGTMLVIDSGKTRVTVLRDGEVTATIKGRKESGGFFYAEHIARGDDKIFVADVNFAEGGVRVASERIMQFSSGGRFEKVLFEREYTDDMPLQYGNILDMRFVGGALTFLIKTDDGLGLYSIVQGVPSYIRTVSYGDAEYLFHAVYDAVTDQVYAATRRGLICHETETGRLSVLHDFSQTGDVPWALATDSRGSLYMLDLTVGSISLVGGDTVFVSEDIIYRFNADENDTISFTADQSVYQIKSDGHMLFSNSFASYETAYFALRLVIWILAAICAAVSVYTAVRFIAWLMRSSRTSQSKFMAMILVSTILTSTIVAVSILGNSVKTSSEKTRYNLTQMALSVSNLSRQTIGDDLEDVNTLNDYGGPAFTRIHEVLDPICDSAAEQGSNMYYIMYKYVDDMLYAFIDYEGYTGILCPAGDFLGPATRELVSGAIPYVFESGSDAYGSWTLAVTPIFNSSGEIVGIIEMGSNLDVETIQTRNQIQDIIVSTAVLLVLFLLVFSEASAVMDSLAGRNKLEQRPVPGLIRALVFLAFLADCTCAAFIPQLSAKIFQSSGISFSPSIGAALPLSAEMLFTAILAITGGLLIERFGMKRVLLGGTIAEILGLALTAVAVAADSYVLLLVSVCVTGAGLGIIVVSGNTLPLYFSDKSLQNKLFSGVNVGMMSGFVVGVSLGSYAAQAVGYAMTFILSAVVLIPGLLLCVKCAPHVFAAGGHVGEHSGGEAPKLRQPGGSDSGMSLWGFLKHRGVFSFMLFMMFPFLVVLSFKDYIFPLFASESGFSDVQIGNALLFSGAIAIFIVPPMADVILRRFHAKGANIIAGALFAAGLLMYSLWPTIQVAVATVYIINIVGCFGYVVHGVYFSGLRAARVFGAGKAMGIFSLFENLALAAGPLIFGLMLALSFHLASLIIALSLALLVGLFAFLGSNENALPEGEISHEADKEPVLTAEKTGR